MFPFGAMHEFIALVRPRHNQADFHALFMGICRERAGRACFQALLVGDFRMNIEEEALPGRIVSYHPALEADHNLLLISQRPLGPEDSQALARAAVVLLPQVCRPDLYRLVLKSGLPHFPRPAAQLEFSGKVGNRLLFERLGLPQPPAMEFSGMDQALRAWRGGQVQKAGLTPPLVAKGASGGEGRNVFLVNDPDELEAVGVRLDTSCTNGPPGMVLQQYIEARGRDVRVVIMGDDLEAFWRIGAPGEFRANLSQGGVVERNFRPHDLERARELAGRLRKSAGLDLAAVDMLFPPGGGPLLLEINFFFGRRALGGDQAYMRRYLKAVRGWLKDRGLDPQRVRLAEGM